MVAFILFAWACNREAVMDRLYEVYKLVLMEGHGKDRLNKIWFSYNPLASPRGLFGAKRDGWHWVKLQYVTLLIAAIVSYPFTLFFPWWEYPWYCQLGIAVGSAVVLALIRQVVFSASLSSARAKYTVQSNFIHDTQNQSL